MTQPKNGFIASAPERFLNRGRIIKLESGLNNDEQKKPRHWTESLKPIRFFLFIAFLSVIGLSRYFKQGKSACTAENVILDMSSLASWRFF